MSEEVKEIKKEIAEEQSVQEEINIVFISGNTDLSDKKYMQHNHHHH